MDDSKELKSPSLKTSIYRRMILLTFIYTFLSTLIIGYLAFDEAKEQQDAPYVRKMVTQLLDLAQIDKQGVIQYEKDSFLNIIKNVVSDLYPLIEQKKLRLNACAPKDSSISNHLGEVDCLVKNAIENAIKFSAEDGKVEINLSENLKCATLVVENFNVTIPDSQMEKLTEPFFKVNQEKEGSGLGLSICYKIANKMNGNLVLEKTNYQSFKFSYSQPLLVLKEN